MSNDKKEEGLMDVLNNLKDESHQNTNSDDAVNKEVSDENIAETSESPSVSTKKEKKKLGIGPKIAMLVVTIYCVYGFISGPSNNSDVSIKQQSDNKQIQPSSSKEQESVAIGESNSVKDEISNDNSLILHDSDSALVEDEVKPQIQLSISSEQSNNIDSINEELISELAAGENGSADELIDGLSELEDISSAIPNELESGVSLGSVVTEDDLSALRELLNQQAIELKELKNLYAEEISSLKPQISMLKSQVEMKKYDLSWEKDRPEISKLIISRPLTECETCIAHASWEYNGVRVQKGNKSTWMGFAVTLTGDKLNLTKNEASYDYWSTKNSY